MKVIIGFGVKLTRVYLLHMRNISDLFMHEKVQFKWPLHFLLLSCTLIKRMTPKGQSPWKVNHCHIHIIASYKCIYRFLFSLWLSFSARIAQYISKMNILVIDVSFEKNGLL